LSAQTISGQPVPLDEPSLAKRFTAWEVYHIPSVELESRVKNNPGREPVELQFGQHSWKLDLEPSSALAPSYTLQVWTDHGLEVHPRTETKAFRGLELNAGEKVRLTLDEHFIHGFVMRGADRTYIQPLRNFVPQADPDHFIVYAASAVIRDQDATCGLDELPEHLRTAPEPTEVQPDQPDFVPNACYKVEIAIASDRSMFDKYGSVSEVENHNIAVINDVQDDYTGNFNHDLE
jgi:hypothetical protein